MGDFETPQLSLYRVRTQVFGSALKESVHFQETFTKHFGWKGLSIWNNLTPLENCVSPAILATANNHGGRFLERKPSWRQAKNLIVHSYAAVSIGNKRIVLRKSLHEIDVSKGSWEIELLESKEQSASSLGGFTSFVRLKTRNKPQGILRFLPAQIPLGFNKSEFHSISELTLKKSS